MNEAVDRLRRLSTLLDEAMDLDASTLAVWLQGLAPEDVPLRAALIAMLERRDDRGSAVLSTGPPKFTLARADEDTPDAEFAAHERIGPYRLVRVIGRGGMGEVWLAERDDGQLARAVALKLPMLGERRSVLVQRFARERDIVGRLAHPNIARLYDAGVGNDGQPFLAFEYVDGTAITEFCRDHELDLRSRVSLLLQVIGAVQYAHANLIIHRDIKPSNVLVTGQKHAMLLDFGIAKLLLEEHGDAPETELTRLGGRAMTLHYAAPEQISGAAINIATDIWALGVLGYELFSCQRPFGGARRALETAILTAEPLRPQGLPDDLATIVLKAMKKAPSERYTTAEAMAADLRRWRDGEAVLAQPDSAAYRLRKFVTRHAIGVGVVAAFAGIVLAASIVALWQAGEAREQARIARTEARTSAAVQDFLEQLFRANRLNQADPLAARKKTAEQLLDEGAARIDGALVDAPAAKLRVLGVLADMYDDMSNPAAQAALAEKREQLAAKAYPGATAERLEALAALSTALLANGRQKEGEAKLAEARLILLQRPQIDPAALLRSEMRLVETHIGIANPDGLDDARRLVSRLEPMSPPTEDLVSAYYMRGTLERLNGLHADAVNSLQRALAAEKRVPGGAAGELGVIYQELSRAQTGLGEMEMAEASQRTAVRLTESNSGPASISTLKKMVWLAQLLSSVGRPRESLVVIAELRARLLQMPGDALAARSQVAAEAAAVATQTELRLGHPEAALRALNEIRSQIKAPVDDALGGDLLAGEAHVLMQLGRLAEAGRLIDELERRMKARPDPGGVAATRLAQARVALALAAVPPFGARVVWEDVRPGYRGSDAAVLDAEVALAAGDPTSATRVAAESLVAMRTRPRALGDEYRRFRLLLVLGQARVVTGRPFDAVQPLKEALAWNFAACDPSSSPDRITALTALGEALAALGQGSAAQQALSEAKSIRERHNELGPQYTIPLARLSAGLDRSGAASR